MCAVGRLWSQLDSLEEDDSSGNGGDAGNVVILRTIKPHVADLEGLSWEEGFEGVMFEQDRLQSASLPSWVSFPVYLARETISKSSIAIEVVRASRFENPS